MLISINIRTYVLRRHLDKDLNPVPKLLGEPVFFPVLGHTPRHLLLEHLAGKGRGQKVLNYGWVGVKIPKLVKM